MSFSQLCFLIGKYHVFWFVKMCCIIHGTQEKTFDFFCFLWKNYLTFAIGTEYDFESKRKKLKTNTLDESIIELKSHLSNISSSIIVVYLIIFIRFHFSNLLFPFWSTFVWVNFFISSRISSNNKKRFNGLLLHLPC